MARRQAGTIDTSYGANGSADIPAEHPHDPDNVSLQVEPSISDGNGNLVFFGYNPGDSDRGLFTRILVNGQWDSATGHVPIAVADNPHLPDESLRFRSLLTVTVDGRPTYYAAGSPTYFDYEQGRFLNYLGISRFDQDFQPVKAFGEDGHALPEPGQPWEMSRRTVNRPNAAFYSAENPLAMSAGLLRTIFPYTVGDEDDEVTHSWLATLHPNTGELVEALGEQRNRSTLPLSDRGVMPLKVLRAHFFEDGGFVVLAHRGDDHVILRRYNAHGMPIDEFGDQGQRDLFPYQGSMRLGMDYRNGRIVVSRAMEMQLTEPTTVYAFTDDGDNDPAFNNGQPVTLSRDDKGLALGQLVIDEHDRIVLGGAHLTAVNVGELNVFRLTRAGLLDPEFGNGGLFEGGSDFRTANKLFLNQDGIRILTLFPTEGYFLERVLKLHN